MAKRKHRTHPLFDCEKIQNAHYACCLIPLLLVDLEHPNTMEILRNLCQSIGTYGLASADLMVFLAEVSNIHPEAGQDVGAIQSLTSVALADLFSNPIAAEISPTCTLSQLTF